MTVYKDLQRQGHGRRLLGDIIEAARRAGYHALVAMISADNTDSVAFFGRLGFNQVGLFKQVGFKLGR